MHEGGTADRFETVREIDLRQSSVVMEGSQSDLSDRRRQPNLFQRLQMGEGAVADLNQSFRKNDRLQSFIAVEGIVADLRQRQSADFGRQCQFAVFSGIADEFAVVVIKTDTERTVFRIHGNDVVISPACGELDIFAAMGASVDIADNHLADEFKTKFGSVFA